MKKFVKITLISAVCLLVVGLVLSCMGVFWIHRSVSISDPIDNTPTYDQNVSIDMATLTDIDISAGLGDLHFVLETDPAKARVEASGFIENELTISQANGLLAIDCDTSSTIFGPSVFGPSIFHFGEYFIDWKGRLHKTNHETRTITVYLSQVELDNFTISGGLGNISTSVPASNSWDSSSIDAANQPLIDADTIDISNGAGNLSISNIKANSLAVDCGLGNFAIKNFSANSMSVSGGAGNILLYNGIITERISVSGGLGDTQLDRVTANDLAASAGAGTFRYTGIMRGKCTIDGGLGNIILAFEDSAQNYSMKLEHGLGNIDVKNADVTYNDDGYIINPRLDTENNLSVNVGAGNLSIVFDER